MAIAAGSTPSHWLKTPAAVVAALVLAAALAFAAALIWPSQNVAIPGADLDPATVVAQVKSGTKATAALRTALAAAHADPANARLAKQAAAALIAEGRANGDARLVGASLGLLQPFLALEDAEALTMAATARQYQHDFAGALALLDRALALDRRNAAALLNRATIQTVLGAFDRALPDCAALQRLGQDQVAFLCQSTALMLTDRATTIKVRLEAILATPGLLDPALRGWAVGLTGEIAALQGDRATARARFAEVLAADPAAIRERLLLADLLLADGEGAGVLALLAGQPETDSLLIRRTLASGLAGDAAQAAADSAELAKRFAQNIDLGLTAHAREEARFYLRIARDPALALERAEVNWALQHEAEDAALLVDAAMAAGQPARAVPVLVWMQAQSVAAMVVTIPDAVRKAAP